MRRNIFYDKINRAYGNRENELSNDLFRRQLLKRLHHVHIFTDAFPRSCSRAIKLCFSVISENYHTILCGYLDQRKETDIFKHLLQFDLIGLYIILL